MGYEQLICWKSEDDTYPNQHFIYMLQTVTGESRISATFLPRCTWGSNWRYSSFFCDQNNRSSSDTYITCIYCGLSMKINKCEKSCGAQDYHRHMRKDNGWILFAFVSACVIDKYPNTPIGHGAQDNHRHMCKDCGCIMFAFVSTCVIGK